MFLLRFQNYFQFSNSNRWSLFISFYNLRYLTVIIISCYWEFFPGFPSHHAIIIFFFLFLLVFLFSLFYLSFNLLLFPGKSIIGPLLFSIYILILKSPTYINSTITSLLVIALSDILYSNSWTSDLNLNSPLDIFS